jgi:hypothetical protein
LDCILYLSKGDKMDSISNIGRKKFGWTTTRGLLKLRTLLGMKPSDGRDINTSGRGNRVSWVASIKLCENSVLLSRREGFYNSGG